MLFFTAIFLYSPLPLQNQSTGDCQRKKNFFLHCFDFNETVNDIKK